MCFWVLKRQSVDLNFIHVHTPAEVAFHNRIYCYETVYTFHSSEKTNPVFNCWQSSPSIVVLKLDLNNSLQTVMGPSVRQL